MFHAVIKNVVVQFVLEKSIIGINKFDDFNKTEIAALSASRRREKLTWQTKITLDDNSACSIQDYRN